MVLSELIRLSLIALLSGLLSTTTVMSDDSDIHYGLTASSKVLQTSEAGDRLASKDNFQFKTGSAPADNIIRVHPDMIKQTLTGTCRSRGAPPQLEVPQWLCSS